MNYDDKIKWVNVPIKLKDYEIYCVFPLPDFSNTELKDSDTWKLSKILETFTLKLNETKMSMDFEKEKNFHKNITDPK